MRIINLVDSPENNIQKQKSIINEQNFNQMSKNNIELTVINNNLVQQQQIVIRTLSSSINILLKCKCANVLVHWLTTRLLNNLTIYEQPNSVLSLCSVLMYASDGLPSIEHAYILHNLIIGLNENEQIAQLILEQISQMNIEELTVLSTDTILALKKLLNTTEFSSRAVKVAALLSLNHFEAEKVKLKLI